MTFTLPPTLAAALLPRYQLGDPIAEGGQAVVLRATDTVVGRDVALKLLPLASTSAVGRERFLREIRLMAQLSHPAIIPIFDAGEAPGVLWYAMALVPGDTLAARLRHGRIAPELVRQWGSEIAEALAVAHARGVVHRDVKPGNIHLLEGHALLADFGVAALDGDETLTSPGDTPGSRWYMAPEQLRGSADPRADIYGLGVSLIEAATGAPWEVGNPRWSALPRSLRALLRRAVAEQPEQRWQSATAFRNALLGRQGRIGRWLMGAAAVVVIGVAWRLGTAPQPLVHSADIQLTGFDGSRLGRQLARATVTRLEWFPPVLTAPWRESGEPIDARWRVEGSLEPSPRGPIAVLAIRDSSGAIQDLLQIGGDSTDLPGWASAVAEAIVGAVAPTRSGEFHTYGGGARVGAALWRFYEGQAAFERQEWTAAETAFREAAVLDPGFQQARWSVLLTRKWARLPYTDELRALDEGGELPPPLGALVAAQLEGDLARRISLLDSLARAWPRVAEVHLVRANELFHRGPLTGRTLPEALDALEGAAGFFPSLDRPVVWDHVAWGAIRLGDERRTRAALARQRTTARGGDPWSQLLRYATESRFRPLLGRLLEFGLKLGGRSPRDRLGDAMRLGTTFDLPASQLRLAEWLGRSSDPAAQRASDLSARALALLMLGRPRAAIAAIDSAAVLLPNDVEYARQRWEWRLLLPAVGIPVDLPEQNRARSALQDAATRGDTRALEVLEQGAVPSLMERVAIVESPDLGATTRTPFFRALSYLTTGERQLAAGDTARALQSWRWVENVDLRGWPNAAPQEGEIDAALSPLARWRRATLLHAFGQTAEACLLLHQVERLWRDAEPEVRALLSTAEPVPCRM